MSFNFNMFLTVRVSVYVHLLLCSVILGKPYKSTLISNNYIMYLSNSIYTLIIEYIHVVIL